MPNLFENLKNLRITERIREWSLLSKVGVSGIADLVVPINVSNAIKLLPYRTKIRRTKVSKFQFGVENFVRRNILSVENFVHYFNTKVRQKSDKIIKISA